MIQISINIHAVQLWATCYYFGVWLFFLSVLRLGAVSTIQSLLLIFTHSDQVPLSVNVEGEWGKIVEGLSARGQVVAGDVGHQPVEESSKKTNVRNNYFFNPISFENI